MTAVNNCVTCSRVAERTLSHALITEAGWYVGRRTEVLAVGVPVLQLANVSNEHVAGLKLTHKAGKASRLTF